MSQNPPRTRVPLGEILVKAGIVSAEHLADALAYQKETGFRIGECLVKLGHCKPDDVCRALGKQSGLPFVDLRRGTIAPEVIAAIPRDVAEEHNILPVKIEPDGRVILAVTDPLAAYGLDHLRFVLGLEFRCALTTEAAMLEALERYHGISKKGASTVVDKAVRLLSAGANDEGPVIRLVQSFFEDATSKRASDIHVEPMADRVRVRFRVDGVCRTMHDLPKSIQGPVISRIKILSGMDIAEKRKPQDGRIETAVADRSLDVRVSALPGTHGESVVMRLLDKKEGLVSLERLGFVGEENDRFQRIIRRPNGLFLVTGPTGSGKTTSLYAALQTLNRPQVKIITAENPVEYHIPGINQCQVRHDIGLDFARILKAMLRQAPNIILVGEIRDKETASIAIQASLTGHLVFSTLHTNDAVSALTRLVDMGVARFLVSSSVCAVMAQRLIRRLCNHCKQPDTPAAAEMESVGLDPVSAQGKTIYRGKGCGECNQSGYKGRVGIFELLEMRGHLREAIFRGASAPAIRELAGTEGGMRSLRQDAVRKILGGVTSLEEVLRVLSTVSVVGA